jgi:hypothetical protein
MRVKSLREIIGSTQGVDCVVSVNSVGVILRGNFPGDWIPVKFDSGAFGWLTLEELELIVDL